MPRLSRRVLARIRDLAAARKIRFTLKARREIAGLDLGLDDEDAALVLEGLSADEWTGRVASEATGEWMHIFKPVVVGTVLYVKIIVREYCIVVSFHADDGDGDEKENL